MTARLFKRMLNVEALGFLLALAALMIFVYGVAASLKDTDASYFYLASLIAMLIGFGLGKVNSRLIQSSVGMAALGAAVVWILGAGLSLPLIRLIRESLILIPQLISNMRFDTEINFSPLNETWIAIVDPSLALAARFQTWFIGINRDVDVKDALIRNLIWLFVLWLIAAWMGWTATRRNAVMVLMPALTLLTLITSYSEFKVETIWALVMALLLLLGVWNYKNHIQQWAALRVDYSESIIFDTTQAVVILVWVIGSLAYITPSVTWRDIREYWRERTTSSNEVADALGIQEGASAPQAFSVQKPALPREHLLSSGPSTSQTIVMTVRTGELPPIADPTLTANAPRYYWRSVVYDKYVGAGWMTNGSIKQNVVANAPLIPGLLKDYRSVRFRVQMQESQGAIFWSGLIFSANIPLTIEWRVRPTSDLFADQQALLQADIFAAPTNAREYTVEAYQPIVTLDALRSASTEYPEEISTRYLSVPASLPDRVQTLAKEITANLDNPYTQAKAIEAYLRSNYEYDLEVPAPPADRDVVDYFLFDLKRGYCDYYASAMVILARLNGLPARFVSGYAPGEYDAPNAMYVVRELNAHSWAEIYYPGIGWIEFEPTASIQEIVRDDSEIPIPTDIENTEPAPQRGFRLPYMRLEWLSILPVLLILALIVYYVWYEKWTYKKLAPAPAIEKIYQQFYRSARKVTGTTPQRETSLEFTQRLIETIMTRQQTSRLKYFETLHQNETNALTTLYNDILFSDRNIPVSDFETAWSAWNQIRWRLQIARIISLIKKRS